MAMEYFCHYSVPSLIRVLCTHTTCASLFIFPLSPRCGDIFLYRFHLSPRCILSCLLLYPPWIQLFLLLYPCWTQFLLCPNLGTTFIEQNGSIIKSLQYILIYCHHSINIGFISQSLLLNNLHNHYDILRRDKNPYFETPDIFLPQLSVPNMHTSVK